MARTRIRALEQRLRGGASLPRQIADRVHRVAEALEGQRGVLPLEIAAPLQAAAEIAAPRVVRAHGLDDDAVDDVTAYIVIGATQIMLALDREHLAEFRRETAA